MSDLVERLRDEAAPNQYSYKILNEAANEIERLEQANARLTNFMHRVQDSVKGFELVDSKEQDTEQGESDD